MEEINKKTDIKPPLDFSRFPKVRSDREVEALKKVLSKSNMSESEINNIIYISKMLATAYDSEKQSQPKQFLANDEMVKLNIDKIYSYSNWELRQESYKQYIKDHEDTIFSVKHLDSSKTERSIVSLIDELGIESPWNFCDMDLLVYDKSDNSFKELWLIEN